MMQEETDDIRLRFGVQGGGCSGLSYALGFDDEVNNDLDETEIINEIPVVMNKQDMLILENTEIDFKQKMLGGGLSINNQKAIRPCGGGSSFKPDTQVGQPKKC